MKTILLSFALAVGAAVVVGSIAFAGRAPTSPNELALVSNQGTSIDRSTLSISDKAALDRTNVSGELRQLAQRDGVSFWKSANAGGDTCFLTGKGGRSPALSAVFCPRTSESSFPSATSPILDSSTFTLNGSSGTSRLVQLGGFAADGVARVGVVGQSGNFYLTRVVQNVYTMSDVPSEPVDAVVGLDRGGNEIYRMPLVP